MCQSTGVLVISNYMVLELNKLGVEGSIPLLLLAVYNSWAACLNYVNALLIDRIGRIRIITIGIVSSLTNVLSRWNANIHSEWLHCVPYHRTWSR